MNLGAALGIPEDVFQYKGDDRLVLPHTRLGVEFEFEGVGVRGDSYAKILPKEGWAAYWEVKPDRSLHDNGAEFVFARPLFGADALVAVDSLLRFARTKDYKISKRTGFHVHVDVRDMTRNQLAVFVVLYALFEKAVYNVAGNDRDQNVFCLPWYKSDQISLHAQNVCTDYTDIRAAAKALEHEKYGGLNLDCLVRFGTAEFRQALTTYSFDWSLKWLNLCLSFKRAAQKLDTAPLEIIHNLSAIGPENFARLVFEDQFDLINYTGLVRDVWASGVETALLVLPKQQELIDKASLSWNQKNAAVGDKAPENVNESFKAYVEANAKKQEPARTDQIRPAGVVFDEFAPLNREMWVDVQQAPLPIQEDGDEEPEDYTEDEVQEELPQLPDEPQL